MATRKTVQRALVLEAVRSLQSHATAEEVYEEVCRRHPNVSRGTVYRNLQRLCEMGEIQKVEIPGGADRFDHLCHDHYHIRCTVCGRVYDVDMAYIRDLEHGVRNAHGFQFTGHDIMFRGVCPDCAAAQEKVRIREQEDNP